MTRPRNRRTILPDNIRRNMELIRSSVPAGTRIMAVVKADGYGHGAAEVSRAAISGGADMLAVASVEEGVRLRRAGFAVPVLVLGAVTKADVSEGIDSGLIQTVCTPEMVEMCEMAAKAAGKTAEVHLKVDTGMGRIGIRTPEERDYTIRAFGNSPHVRLTGVFTHFSDADGSEEGMAFTEAQFAKFLKLTEPLPPEVLRHCSNSAAIHRRRDFAMDMVRAGISLYGYPPVETDLPLKPCMQWTAKVSHVKTIEAGEYISYGRTFRSERPMKIATVTCGYADGYHRCSSGKAHVIIHGKRVPVIGRICMDQMMADVTGMENVQPEDEVILMGSAGSESISAEDIARWSGTISYEILLSVGSRVERVFQYGKGSDSDAEKE